MTRPTEPREAPLVARLEGAGMPGLIRELSSRAATGVLHVTRDGIEREVYFDEGRVTFARSSSPDDRLGEQLLRLGRVNLGQLEAALRARRPGIRLGSLMVDAGILTAEERDEAVAEQIEMILCDLLRWTAGEYRFDAGPLPSEEAVSSRLTTEQLILRGIRDIQSLALVERGLGPPRTVFRLIDELGRRTETLELTEGARLVLERLARSPASVEQVCREVCVSNFEIYRTLWAAKLLGLVQPCGRRAGNAGFEGNLDECLLAQLLLGLEADGQTGVLYVTHGMVERSILFASGRCVFATSNDPDDGLVSFLFRRGVISLRDKEETTRRLLSNKRVGTILRELGAIDDADLRRMVRQQVSEIVYDTLGWERGEFVFVAGPLPHAEEITLNSSVAALVAEGVRRVTSWTRLVRGCGGIDNPLCLTPRYLEVLDEIGAGGTEWQVVNALKSPQSPRRVCKLIEADDFRVCQILWTLKLLGAVDDSPVEVAGAAVEGARGSDPRASEFGRPIAAGEAENGEGPRPFDGPETLVAIELGERLPRTDLEPPAGATSAEAHPDPAGAGADPAAAGGREWVEGELCASQPAGWPAADTRLDTTEGVGIDDPASGSAESATGEGPAEAAPPSMPPEIEECILRFNEMHRLVFRAVRIEIGAGAVNFVRACCDRLDAEVPDPVEGVTLHNDGSWDLDGLRRVIAEKRIDDPWGAYQRVLDEEFVSLQPHLSETKAGRLRQQIWQLEQAR